MPFSVEFLAFIGALTILVGGVYLYKRNDKKPTTESKPHRPNIDKKNL